MKELIELFTSLMKVMNPKEYESAIISKCRPNIDDNTGNEYTYKDVTSQIASGTILQFAEGGKLWSFTAEPAGTPYFDKKLGTQSQLKADKYSLNHIKTVDNDKLATVLA
tara:strand:- start:1422 stop:1751 length:330 start_codon:yes stop_codon:yes gene_type:complete